MNPYSHEDRRRATLEWWEAMRAMCEQKAAEPVKPEPSDAEALAVGKVLLAGYRLGAR